MAWNHPGNDNGRDRDPWKSTDNQIGKSKGNKKKQDQRYSDINNLFRKLNKKFSNLGSDTNFSILRNNVKLASCIAAISVTFWVMSGFYTIKEAERGVVTRFGKFNHLVEPGLNWKPTFIDKVQAVNVETVRELAASGIMLTSDENVVRVEMNVQYRVTDPKRYLFSVANPDDSLRQVTDSALRGVIGRSSMDRILTEGRTVVRSETQKEIDETIRPYNIGINVMDVNFQAARPPEEVKAAFDDAIAARENREQYVREAEAYANEVKPRANGKAQRILEEARAYKVRAILEAQGEVERFTKLLPEYKVASDITKNRLYIESMERMLSHTRKVLINNNNLIVLPLDTLINRKNSSISDPINKENSHSKPLGIIHHNNKDRTNNSTSFNRNDIMDQRRANAIRTDIQREERK